MLCRRLWGTQQYLYKTAWGDRLPYPPTGNLPITMLSQASPIYQFTINTDSGRYFLAITVSYDTPTVAYHALFPESRTARALQRS
jgi:hypothetical protein